MARSLSQKTLIIAAGTGIQSTLTLVAVNLFLVRIMESQVEFGIYRQVWLVVNTAIPVFTFGLDAALYYFYSTLPPDCRRSFLRRTVGLLSLSGFILAGILFAGSSLIASAFSAPEVAPLLHALSLYVLFGLPSVALFHFLIADDRAVLAVAYNLLFLVVLAGLTVGLIAAKIELKTVFYVLGLFMGVRVLHVLFEIRRLTRGSWRTPIPVSLKSHLRYAFPVGFTATLTTMGGRIDKFVVASFLGPAVYGLYSVGALEVPLVLLLGSAAATVIRMRVSSLHHSGRVEEILGLYLGAFRKLSLTLVPMGLWLALFSRELIVVLYTGQYVGATQVFRIYLFLVLFRLMPFEPFLSSMGRTRAVFTGGIVFLVLDLALNVAGVKSLGMVGPPLATVLATGGLTLYYSVHLARVLKVPIGRLFPLRTFGRIALVSAAATLAALPLRRLPWSPGAILLASLVLSGGVYLGLGLATRTIARGDLRLLGGLTALLDARSEARRATPE